MVDIDWKSLEVHARKSLDCPEKNIGRNTDVKGASGRAQPEMRTMLLETGGKVILVIKWQRTWLNCGLVICRRLNS